MSGDKPGDYAEFWLKYKEKNADGYSKMREIVESIISKNLPCDTIQSMLSVGHGEGDTEAYVIEKCLPNLRDFYGLDIRKEATDATINSLSNIRSRANPIKTHMNQGTIQEYDGPKEKVDLIYISHVFYYISDELSHVINKTLTWLAPGGHMVLHHANPENSKFLQKGDNILSNGNFLNRYGTLKNETKQTLKHDGWTVDDYYHDAPRNFQAEDHELKWLIRLQFDVLPSAVQLQELKQLLEDVATDGHVTLQCETSVICRAK